MGKIYTTEDDIKEFRKEMENEKNNKYGNVKKNFKHVKNGLFGLVVISLIGVLLMVNSVKSQGRVPTIFGYSLYQVETGSMTPTLPIGSIILSENYEKGDELQVGDIVTFNWDDDIVTHRIIEEVKQDGKTLYRTKGDNPNNSTDPDLLSPDNVRGIFKFKLPFTG